MSKRRTERLLSIVVLLLSSRRYLTAEQIRASVSGYPDAGESFKRMFERDKDELRELGIPLETGKSSAFDDEIGYRIRRQDYELPEIQLAADEAAVLGIAARVWQSAELAGAAAGAPLNRRGRWYVAGHDRGRDAPRVFRMSRITGPVKMAGPPGSVKVPDGTDVRDLVKDWDRTPPRDRTAVLRIRDGAGVP